MKLTWFLAFPPEEWRGIDMLRWLYVLCMVSSGSAIWRWQNELMDSTGKISLDWTQWATGPCVRFLVDHPLGIKIHEGLALILVSALSRLATICC